MVPLFLLAIVFAVLAGGNVTILSVYVLQLLGPGASGTGTGAFWVGAVAMGLAVSSVISLLLWGKVLDRIDPARVLVFATAGAFHFQTRPQVRCRRNVRRQSGRSRAKTRSQSDRPRCHAPPGAGSAAEPHQNQRHKPRNIASPGRFG